MVPMLDQHEFNINFNVLLFSIVLGDKLIFPQHFTYQLMKGKYHVKHLILTADIVFIT